MRIIGYAICGTGEAERYAEKTLECFKNLCDDTIILLNNATDKEKELIAKYGFKTVEDNREWGTNQNRIKTEFMKEVEKLNPDWCVCLDMDEVLDTTRAELEKYAQNCRAYYVYIVNLIEDGWNRPYSFWNIRFWKWDKDVLSYFGDEFYRFESRPLHCGLAPRWAYLHGSYMPIILLHYGLKSESDRTRKIERYAKYDPTAQYRDKSYYTFLTKATNEPLDLVMIKKKIEEELLDISYKDRPVKNLTIKGSAYCFFRRKKDGFVFDVPEKDYAETKLKDDFEELYWIGERKTK
jgi:hypothetical protein